MYRKGVYCYLLNKDYHSSGLKARVEVTLGKRRLEDVDEGSVDRMIEFKAASKYPNEHTSILKKGDSLVPSYSVLMGVYAKEQAGYLRESLTSMLTQTVAPDQIVVVEDGPLTTQLTATIKGFQKQYPDIFTIVSLSQNSGLGTALAQGILACRNEIVVRMDSDDYSFPQRVQKEITVMERQQLDIVGSQIVEFIDSPDTPVSESNLPCDQEDITAYSKRRNPFRHPAVAFRKTKVLSVGNYSKEYSTAIIVL